MHGAVRIPDELNPVGGAVADALARVETLLDAELASDLPPVTRLCRHVERYRGKMLRPTLVVVCGLACERPGAGSAQRQWRVGDEHVTIAAVCEMVHMATLVHDDVLDEADVRRRASTVNRLADNETAVILGDLLIAGAYHLCASLPTTRAARAIGRASMAMAAGELVQLHHRGDSSLDEATYYEILDRKTAELIATACELGGVYAGADADAAQALGRFGRLLGVAFQIQDDILDLAGREEVVGKSVGKDFEKRKATLPLIHHLATASTVERGRTLAVLDAARPASDRELLDRLRATGSIAYARCAAQDRVAWAKAALAPIPPSPPRVLLELMADAVVDRAF